ncbi:MAG: AI-2E family transporter [bacterium]|nr:AI-2E family transporter [bacterium]
MISDKEGKAGANGVNEEGAPENSAESAAREAAEAEAKAQREQARKEKEAFEKLEKQRVWRSARVPLVVALVTVLVYEIFENMHDVSTAVGTFFSVLKPVFIGIAFAFIANMPMRFLETRVFKRWKICSLKRAVCQLLAMLFILLIVAAMLFLIIPRIAGSVVALANGMDGYIESLTAWGSDLWDRLNLNPGVEERIQSAVQTILAQLDELLSALVASAAKFTVSIASTLVDVFFAAIISIYALFNKEKLIFQAKKVVVAIFNERRAERILDVSTRTNQALNHYFYGMIIECTILGTLCFIAMTIFGFPYALLISVVVGVTQIVPIIGPWVSALFGALIILVSDPSRVIWFIVLVLVVQQIEANVFYPRVVGNAVGLSGIWVMIAVLLGSGLFGIVGIVLCVPVMAVLYTLVSEWVNRRVEEKRFAAGMRKTPPTEEEIEGMTEK